MDTAKTKKRKATAAEMEQRVTAVVTLLVGGAERAEIVKFAADKWNCNSRSTDALIKRATARIQEESATERKFEIGLAKRRLNNIYHRSMKVQNYNVAISATKERNALFGLHQPQTLKIIGELLTPQAAAKLAALLKIMEPVNEDPGALFDELIAVYVEQLEAKKAHEQQSIE